MCGYAWVFSLAIMASGVCGGNCRMLVWFSGQLFLEFSFDDDVYHKPLLSCKISHQQETNGSYMNNDHVAALVKQEGSHEPELGAL